MNPVRNLEALRQALRNRDPSALRDRLSEQLDGLEHAETPGAVTAWMERGACTAARIVARALDLESNDLDWAESEALAPGTLLEKIRTPGFWPENDAPLKPPAGEVGARAMKRHPLIGDTGLPGGPVTGR